MDDNIQHRQQHRQQQQPTLHTHTKTSIGRFYETKQKHKKMNLKIGTPEPPVDVTPNLVSPRGAKLAIRIWNPPQPPKALLVVVHGGGWHCGYFSNLGEELATNHDILVVGYDQPGCGYSEKEPTAPEGEFGIVHFDSFDDLVSEIYNVIEYSTKYLLSPNDSIGKDDFPIFLLGESFGGVQVLRALLDAPTKMKRFVDQQHYKIRGVILLGGMISIKEEFLPPKIVIQILVWLSTCFPRTLMPATDFSQTYNEAFGDVRWATISRSDSMVCINPRPTIQMIKEILCQGDIVVNRIHEISSSAANTSSDTSSKTNAKILAIHAIEDCRTDASAVEALCTTIGIEQAEFVPIYGTTGHQLLQDQPDITIKVITKISQWIDTQKTTK